METKLQQIERLRRLYQKPLKIKHEELIECYRLRPGDKELILKALNREYLIQKAVESHGKIKDKPESP